MGPLCSGEVVEELPAGWLAGMRASRLSVQGCTVSQPRNRFAQSEGRSPETAASGWPFSWLLLFGHSKRSDSLAGRRVNTRHGCRAAKRRALAAAKRRAFAAAKRRAFGAAKRHALVAAKRHAFGAAKRHAIENQEHCHPPSAQPSPTRDCGTAGATTFGMMRDRVSGIRQSGALQ